MFRFKSLFYYLSVCFGIAFVLSISAASAFAAEKPEIFAQKGSGKLKYLALSPKEDLLLSIADWKDETAMGSAVKVWDVKSRRILKDIKVKETIIFSLNYRAGFSTDQRFVYFVGNDTEIFIYNIQDDTYQKYDLTKYFSSQQLHDFIRSIVSADISDNIITIRQQSQDDSVSDNDYDDRDVEVVKIIDANSGKLIKESRNKTRSIVRPQKGTLSKKGISSNELVFSRDRSNFYTVTGKCTLGDEDEALLNLYSAKNTDALVSTIRLQKIACSLLPIRYAIAFSGRHNKFFTGHSNGNIVEWDSFSGREIARFGAESGVDNQAYMVPVFDKYLFTLGDESIIWDVIAGRMTQKSSETDDLWETDKIFAYVHEKSIGTDKDKKKTVLMGPEAESADKRLKAKLIDGTVKLIDNLTGREVAELISFKDGEWIVITPDGYFNASPNGAKHLNVRVGNSVYGIDQFYGKFYRPELVQLALAGNEVPKGESLGDILAKKPAPTVQILSPASGSSIDKDSITVSLRIIDSGGGIGNVMVYLNGSQVANETRGVIVKGKGPANEKTMSFTISLMEGQNEIRVIAFNTENSMESDPAFVSVVSKAVMQKPNLYALVIGINEYKNKSISLNYAVPDAKAFAETLKKTAAPLFEKIVVQVLTRPAETTRDAITNAFEALHPQIKPNDLFVFYNASHGLVDVVDDEEQYFLLTSNVLLLSSRHIGKDAMSQKELAKLIGSIPAQKKVVILDTCNAGKGGKEIQIALLQQTRGLTDSTAVKLLQRAIGSAVFSASSDTQLALEGYKGHGLFTYVLLEGLKGKADVKKDGYITVLGLADYVEENVIKLSEEVFKRQQTPTIQTGANFPIGKVR